MPVIAHLAVIGTSGTLKERRPASIHIDRVPGGSEGARVGAAVAAARP